MIGMICVICPVISNTMTDTEMVCVTAPEKAAAPTVAYPPGKYHQLDLLHFLLVKLKPQLTRYDWSDDASVTHS